jgi:hypothetical protein
MSLTPVQIGLTEDFMGLFDSVVANPVRVCHLKDLARHLQWQYTPTLPWQSLPFAESFELFRGGEYKTVENVLHGMAGPVQVIAFDYSYRFKVNRSLSDPVCQTVAMFGAPSINLPLFQLHPRSFSNRFASGSIGVAGYPKFAEQYFLTGSDQSAIRALFTHSLITALEANPGWSIDGGGGQFFFYRKKQIVAPEQMQWLIETGQRVLKLMETPEAATTTS